MANNNGLFITKSGVSLPVVTEMSSSAWAAYANDLTLALVRNTNHVFNAFEGFKYRAYITDDNGTPTVVLFNNKTNYVPHFILGSGSLNTSNGEITALSEPIQVEESNKVFLQGSSLEMEGATGKNIQMRIASLDADDYIIVNPITGALSQFKDGAEIDTDTLTTTDAELHEIAVSATEITFGNVTDGELFSFARTYQCVLSAAGLGVLTSSGTQTGSNLAFSATETFDSANSVISGTLTVTSSFGQTTIYDVELGDTLTENNIGATITVDFVAGQSSLHDTADDFTGGVGEKGYSLVSGSLPSGMVLTSGGLIQGVPTTDGIFNAIIEVDDLTGDAIQLEYQFTVTAAANVNYNPPPAIEDEPYDYNPQLAGITAALIIAGALPSGLALNSSNGAVTGTPTNSGAYSFTIRLTFGATVEEVPSVIIVYESMVVEGFSDGDSLGLISSGQDVTVDLNDQTQVVVTGGSGKFQYSISGGNLISSTGAMQLFETGEFTVTVIDTVTGQTITFKVLVAGQAEICGLAIEEEAEDESVKAPCVDIITDCNSPVTVGFNSMHILKGIESGGTAFREYPNFDQMEGAEVSNSGKAFAMFLSKAPNGWAQANNGRDGKPFLITFSIDGSVANGTGDVAIGVARKWDTTTAILSAIEYAVVITTVNGDRSVEVRKDNIYQVGSRYPIAEGEEVGFAVFGDGVFLYVNGLLKFQLTGNTFACSGVDIVFFAEQTNMIVGGRASNLIYAIDTTGSADQVGTINPQTGEYTPSLNNVSLVRISGTNNANGEVQYFAKVRVIKPAMKTSLEKAMIEGIPVDMWIADEERFDELPLRLDKEGRPDRNQVSDPQHLGTLQGSGKMESTQTRTDFRNDRGATSTSLTIDKVVVTGASLAVRDFGLVKRLVPYMKEYNSNGVRTLKQFSTGCHKRMRVFLIWQSPDCGDVPVFDAIEVRNGLSYTPFNIEVGQSVQSNLPVTIEGFPDKDGVLFDYNQYDKAFHRIGQ